MLSAVAFAGLSIVSTIPMRPLPETLADATCRLVFVLLCFLGFHVFGLSNFLLISLETVNVTLGFSVRRRLV